MESNKSVPECHIKTPCCILDAIKSAKKGSDLRLPLWQCDLPFPCTPHGRFVIRRPGKVVQCENHLPKVREMWCEWTPIINSGDKRGRDPSSAEEMSPHEDEAAIKAWMKRCKTIRPWEDGRVGWGRVKRGSQRAATTPGKWVRGVDREINAEQQKRKRAGGWGKKDCEPAASALHQKPCQSFATSDQSPPQPRRSFLFN